MDYLQHLDPLIIFSVLLGISLLIPEFFRKYRILIVPLYIIVGIILGPSVIGIEFHKAFELLAEIGIFFLVFEAGLEIHEYTNVSFGKSLKLTVISASICFIFGFALGLALGELGLISEKIILASLLLGTVMMSASVGEIIPMVKSSLYLREKFASFLIPAVIILDAITLFIISFIVQLDKSYLWLIFFMFGTVAIILAILVILPKLASHFFTREKRKQKEGDFKFVLALLIGIIGIGELIGIHGILIAFLVGMTLGQHIPDEKTYHKLQGLGHGFFIPIFFIILGMEMDITVFYKESTGILLTVSLLVTLLAARLIGGLLFAKMERLKSMDGITIGAILLPKVSAAIAASAIAFDAKIIDEPLFNAVVVMTIITALGTPILVQAFHFEEREKPILYNHTVIVGYGRTSAKLTHLLDSYNKDIAVIDRSMKKIEYLRRGGINAILGNGADLNILNKADIQHAKAAIVTVPDEHELFLVACRIKRLNPECYVIVKIHSMRLLDKCKDRNIFDHYIWPEKLGADEIIKHLMEKKEIIF